MHSAAARTFNQSTLDRRLCGRCGYCAAPITLMLYFSESTWLLAHGEQPLARGWLGVRRPSQRLVDVLGGYHAAGAALD